VHKIGDIAGCDPRTYDRVVTGIDNNDYGFVGDFSNKFRTMGRAGGNHKSLTSFYGRLANQDGGA